MRVVAGTARGRRLVAPEGNTARPTTDRVRESLFNALNSLDAIDGADVLDLFAGSGALGIEALSRGARSCAFVEQDRRAKVAVERNLQVTGLQDQATVHGEAAERFVARAAAAGDVFDLALLDPPYAYEGWAQLLAQLPARLVVIESDRAVDLPAGWDVLREKRYGTTLVVMAATKTDSPPVPPAPSERSEPADPAVPSVAHRPSGEVHPPRRPES